MSYLNPTTYFIKRLGFIIRRLREGDLTPDGVYQVTEDHVKCLIIASQIYREFSKEFVTIELLSEIDQNEAIDDGQARRFLVWIEAIRDANKDNFIEMLFIDWIMSFFSEVFISKIEYGSDLGFLLDNDGEIE